MKTCLRRLSNTEKAVRILALSLWLACHTALGLLSYAQPALPGSLTPPTGPAETGVSPPLPPSPIDQFRLLLTLPPAERDRALADKTEPKRKTLLAKLEEYRALPREERELRLHVLQLQLYLTPLMQTSATQRAALTAKVPKPYRQLVEARLKEWNMLPPPLQKEVLDTETTRQYFVRWQSSKPSERQQILNELPPERRQLLVQRLAAWQAMTPEQREKTSDRFNHYFDLTEEEKHKTLGIFPETERQQMEEVLATFQKLPRIQRERCIESFKIFAGMSPQDRDRFLKNAERWQELTPAERQTWRDLVTALPPSPPGLEVSLPPPLPWEAEQPQ